MTAELLKFARVFTFSAIRHGRCRDALNEIAAAAHVGIQIEETAIPVADDVRVLARFWDLIRSMLPTKGNVSYSLQRIGGGCAAGDETPSAGNRRAMIGMWLLTIRKWLY